MDVRPAQHPTRNTRANTRANTRPGQMTAVMRAMSVAAGPKVLRIGVVQGGRVVEERVLDQRMTVTVGASEAAMFVIPSRNMPTSFKLFQRIGDSYVLNVAE